MQHFQGLEFDGNENYEATYGAGLPERVLQAYLRRYRKDPLTNVAMRAVHAKSHGVWEAGLKVLQEPELAVQLAQWKHLGANSKSHDCLDAVFQLFIGTFAPGGKYRCLVRCSNGSSAIQPDEKSDVRAMAVKILDVPFGDGTEQDHDLIMSNHPAFPISNARHVAEALESPLKFALGWRWPTLRYREVRNLLDSIRQKVETPLGIKYWSQSPYLLGSYPVKYSLVPHQSNVASAAGGDPNYKLRNAADAYLQKDNAVFDLCVQFRTNARTMPIDDATVIWSPVESVPITVGKLTIYPKSPNLVESIGESITFNPWQAPHCHRPLGSVNWIRRLNYARLSELRHRLNNAS